MFNFTDRNIKLSVLYCVILLVVHFSLLFLRQSIRESQIKMYQRRPLYIGTNPVPHHVFTFSTTGSKEINETKRINPNWKFSIYNKETARQFIEKYCPNAKQSYDLVVPVAYKADIFRLCAVWSHGGLYMDDDLLPLRSLDDITLATSDGVLLVEDPPAYNWWGFESGGRPVCNGILAATRKHHPFFTCALDTVISNVERAIDIKERQKVNDILGLTGPRAITKCALPYTFTLRLTVRVRSEPSNFFIGKSRNEIYFIHKPFPTSPGREKPYWAFKNSDYIKTIK